MTVAVHSATSWPQTLALRCFAYDLKLTLLLFVPRPETRRLLGDARSFALALVFVLAATAATHFAVETSHQHDALAFNPWGAYTTATGLAAMVAVLFLIALANDALDRLAAMLTGATIVQMVAVVGGALVERLHDVAALAWSAYCLLATVRVVVREMDLALPRRMAVGAAVVALLWAIGEALPANRLFQPAPAPRPKPLNVERIYLDQPRLVRNAAAAVLPSRAGVPETYFVGFAPYSAQDVFLNETRHAEALFRDKLGAAGRTVLLANSRDTVDELPLANGHNLALVLGEVAAKMDQEDLLFLHLTSHGSSDHQFSVSFENLGLNDLSAQEIGEIVQAADLPWRVVVVAACYSGGYIEPLRSPHTLVMTASRADTVSFGCEHGREYTYFGEALYRDNLVDDDYLGAFERARQTVEQREAREDLEASEPQIWIGEAMAAKLSAIHSPLEVTSGLGAVRAVQARQRANGGAASSS